MLKWSCAALGLGWAASMAYECMWSGGDFGKYIVWGVAGLTVVLGLLAAVIAWENRAVKRKEISPMSWFMMAAVMCTSFYSLLEHTVKGHLTHVPMLPMYIVLFVDFFVSGWYTWWKKLKRRR